MGTCSPKTGAPWVRGSGTMDQLRRWPSEREQYPDERFVYILVGWEETGDPNGAGRVHSAEPERHGGYVYHGGQGDHGAGLAVSCLRSATHIMSGQRPGVRGQDSAEVV